MRFGSENTCLAWHNAEIGKWLTWKQKRRNVVADGQDKKKLVARLERPVHADDESMLPLDVVQAENQSLRSCVLDLVALDDLLLPQHLHGV